MTDKVVGLYGEIGIAGIKELKRDLRALNKELEVTTKKMDRKSLQQKIESKDERLRAANARKQEARDRKKFNIQKTEAKFNQKLLSTRMSDKSFQDIMEKFTSAKRKFMAGEISPTEFARQNHTINQRLYELKKAQTEEDRKQIALSRELIRVQGKRIAQQDRMRSTRGAARTRVNLAAADSKASPEVIKKFKREFALLNLELKRGTLNTREYNIRVSHLTRNFNRASREAVGLGVHLRRLRSSFIALAGAYTVFAGVAQIAEVGKAFESVESSMLAATGSIQAAQAEMQFLRDLSRRLGLDVRSVSDAYAKLTFSAKGKMKTDEIRNLFTGLSEFGRVMGVSEDRMKFAMMAVQQMANKGTVSMEELKRQLSENLPGSMQIFAQAMGVSEAEMIKMVETGKVMSHEVLPAFGLALQKAARQGGALDTKLQSLRVAEGKMRNDWESFQETIFKSGFSDTLSEIYLAIGDLLAGLKPIMAPIIGFLSGFISSITWVIRLIAAALGDFSDFLGRDNIQLLADIGKMLGYVAGLFASVIGMALKIGGVIFGTILKPILDIIKFFMPALKSANIAQKGTSGIRHNVAGAAQFAARMASGGNAMRAGSVANIAGSVYKTDISLDLTPEAKRIIRTNPRKDAARDLDGGVK